MKVFSQSLGVTTRLVLIAVVPACLTFLFIAFFLNNAAHQEVVEDVEVQGHLLAKSLAQSSTYALVSGNTQPLEQSLARLVSTQRTVQSIKILDKEGHEVIAVGTRGPPAIRVEADVEMERLDADSFDNFAPHVSMEPDSTISDKVSSVGKVVVEENFPDLRDALAMTAYRLTQEALSNVVKHASAVSALVSLSTQDRMLCIVVKDDGNGFEVQNRTQVGIGLIGMKERVSAVGGDIDIKSGSGGTRVLIQIPIQS